VWRTGSGEPSISRMISSFSAAGYLMPPPQPRACFFEQPVFQHQLGNHLLQRAGLPAQVLDFLRGCRSRRVAGQALLAGFQKLLRPAVIQVLHNPFAPAQLGNAVLAAQAGQNNADLLLRRKLTPRRPADLFDDLFRRCFHRLGLLSHLRSSTGDDGP
jgi:hypothetical protein